MTLSELLKYRSMVKQQREDLADMDPRNVGPYASFEELLANSEDQYAKNVESYLSAQEQLAS